MQGVSRGWPIVVLSSVWLGLASCAPSDRGDRERADTSFLAGAQASLAQREYRASETGEGLQAPNRRHNLRTYFGPDGIRVHDRTAAGSPRLLELSLVGVGRGSELHAVPAGVARAAGARVEIRRPGLVEWFVNGPEGLEQGFTIAERPGGEGKLVLSLRLEGAKAKPRGDELLFETETGRKLSYGKLAAWDARGEPLVAELAAAETGRIALSVDDAHAEYPIAIDPLLAETADAQLESDQTQANLGISVASAGDVNADGYADVIVGAPDYDAGQTDEGVAFVFHGSANGVADGNPVSADTRLQGNGTFAHLGESVASAGDVNGDGYADVIVGAPAYNTGEGQGAVFVFLGSATGVADGDPTNAHAQLESDQLSAQLGASVAAAGDVNGDGYGDVIVGAPFYEIGENNEGVAFIFHGSASGIPDATPATANAALQSDQASANLGQSVASAGDVNGDGYADVIVGAHFYDNDQTDEGAAFVFLGSASGVADGSPASAHAQLESDQANARLGISVASAGDANGDGYADVIVGAHFYSNGQLGEGAAFVFLGSASGVADGNSLSAHAQLESNQAEAFLGLSVASAGDVNGDGYADVIVGADLYDSVPSNEGAAFIFLGSASGVADGNPASAHAQLESDQAGARLGCSVGSAGDVNGDGYSDVVVGAYFYENGSLGEGAAFVYHGGATGIDDANPTNPASRLESNQIAAELGTSVASAGDVNGDGYGDVIVGARFYDAGQENEGAAFVFHGSPGGIPDAIPAGANTQLESDQANALLGESVASAGDVNGDGYSDVIVGAWFYDNGHSEEGAAFVFLGSASGVADGNPASAHAQLEGNQTGALLGESVGSAGDVNGDGFADVIVGAYTYDNGQSDEGAAFLFLGSASGVADGSPASAHAQLESDQATSFLGGSVASAGDVNGDGYADVIVGASNYADGQSGEGAAFVFLGSASGLLDGNPASAHAQLESNQASAGLGSAAASAGDVNGDGYADVIVGAPLYDNGQVDEGAAFVFHGSASGIADGNPASAHAQLESNFISSSTGWGVASAGDVNGDGYADVIVGAPAYDNPTSNEGAAFVFLGSANGVAGRSPASAHAQIESDQIDALLGESVASAGDVNGDGFADVIVGARSFDSGQANKGIALVLQGGGNRDGRPVLARQRRGDGSGIAVQPWGGAYSGTGFAAELRANHPQGSGRVKAQIQACPQPTPFGDAGCTNALSASWLAVNGATPDVSISHTLSGLVGNQLYRWRARILHAPATGAIAANPAHGPWRRLGAQAVEADFRTGSEPDGDADTVPDATDNCPTVANTTQVDGDGDLVGDACDNCMNASNPRVAATFLTTNPWATLSGGQRDDDHDGYGNKCDAKFVGLPSLNVGGLDLAQFRASNTEDRRFDTCGTTNDRPCAIFDLDEAPAGNSIGGLDLGRFRALNAATPGPRCASCTGTGSVPLPCTAGTSGTCF